MLAGMMLGSEFRLVIERKADGTFRVSQTSQFSGWVNLSRMIEGVREAKVSRDSAGERIFRKKDDIDSEHLLFRGSDGRNLTWDEGDYSAVNDFMSGKDPTLALADRPQGWRKVVGWLALLFGALTFAGGVQNSFFSKKKRKGCRASAGNDE